MRQHFRRSIGGKWEAGNYDRGAGERTIREVSSRNDEIVVSVGEIVNDNDADCTKVHVIHVANRVIMIEPDAGRGRPAERIPLIGERASGRYAVSYLVRASHADGGPQRCFVRPRGTRHRL